MDTVQLHSLIYLLLGCTPVTQNIYYINHGNVVMGWYVVIENSVSYINEDGHWKDKNISTHKQKSNNYTLSWMLKGVYRAYLC